LRWRAVALASRCAGEPLRWRAVAQAQKISQPRNDREVALDFPRLW